MTMNPTPKPMEAKTPKVKAITHFGRNHTHFQTVVDFAVAITVSFAPMPASRHVNVHRKKKLCGRSM
jgi:hypothetical protein